MSWFVIFSVSDYQIIYEMSRRATAESRRSKNERLFESYMYEAFRGFASSVTPGRRQENSDSEDEEPPRVLYRKGNAAYNVTSYLQDRQFRSQKRKREANRRSVSSLAQKESSELESSSEEEEQEITKMSQKKRRRNVLDSDSEEESIPKELKKEEPPFEPFNADIFASASIKAVRLSKCPLADGTRQNEYFAVPDSDLDDGVWIPAEYVPKEFLNRTDLDQLPTLSSSSDSDTSSGSEDRNVKMENQGSRAEASCSPSTEAGSADGSESDGNNGKDSTGNEFADEDEPVDNVTSASADPTDSAEDAADDEDESDDSDPEPPPPPVRKSQSPRKKDVMKFILH